MTKEFSFESCKSINSDEEFKQVKICPFQTHFQNFQYYTQINFQNEEANQPIPSPQYKFMGASYSHDESANQNQQTQEELNNSKLQDEVISQSTINISKSVDICLQSKSTFQSNKIQIAQQNRINKCKNKNAVPNNNINLRKPNHNNKNKITNIKNISPQGILKRSTFELYSDQKPINLSYQMISDKKISFEFAQEQMKSMKRINFSSVLIQKRTRFVLN